MVVRTPCLLRHRRPLGDVDLEKRPVYFVSSNTHSIVNLIGGYAAAHREKIIEFCIRYPVTVMVGVLLALLFGAIALFRLPVQMIPTVDRPEITVETEYLGAAPLEVEREITDRLEEKLNAVESLKEITSTYLQF